MAKRGSGVQVLKGMSPVGEVISVKKPKETRSQDDSSSHDNIGSIESKIPGWITQTNGSVKFNYYGSTIQKAIRTAFRAGTVEPWMIVMPPGFSGESYSGNAFVSDIDDDIPLKGAPVTQTIALTPVEGWETCYTWADGLTTPFFTVADQSSNALTPIQVPGGGSGAAAAIYEYKLTAYSDDTTITITPTAAAGTIYVNGPGLTPDTAVTSGAASGAITIGTTSGSVVYASITVHETNKTPKIYLIRVLKGWQAKP